MTPGHLALAAFMVVVLLVPARAQDPDSTNTHMSHMAMMSQAPDARQLLDFPPPMRQHMLSQMRGHLAAIAEILTALSTGDNHKAAEIAETRLSLKSPGAAACQPSPDAAASPMAAMMAAHMPEEMRGLGYAMHEAAGRFAQAAAKTQSPADSQALLAALGEVTQRCTACHAAYRLN